MSQPQPDYYAQMPQAGSNNRKQGPSWLKIFVVGCLGLGALSVIVTILLVVLGWTALVRFGIRDDLANYQAEVTACGIDPSITKSLLQRMDVIREKVDGRNYGFMDWIPHDEVIQSLLQDHELSELELDRLDKELGLIEKALNLPVGSLPKPPPNE